MYNLVRVIYKIASLEEVKAVGRRHLEVELKLGSDGKKVLGALEAGLGRYFRTFQPYGAPRVREVYRGSEANPRFVVTLLENGKLKLERGQNKPIGRIELARVILWCQKLQKKTLKNEPQQS